jgi:hypothetical protein
VSCPLSGILPRSWHDLAHCCMAVDRMYLRYTYQGTLPLHAFLPCLAAGNIMQARPVNSSMKNCAALPVVAGGFGKANTWACIRFAGAMLSVYCHYPEAHLSPNPARVAPATSRLCLLGQPDDACT